MKGDLYQTIEEIQKGLSEHTRQFSFSFVLIFFVSFGLLYTVGLVPELESVAVANEQEEHQNVRIAQAGVQSVSPLTTLTREKVSQRVVRDAAPTRILIPSLAIDATIENPQSRDIGVLDEALTRGVVHYPGSGSLTDRSNVFLFGHSSHLPVVHNDIFRVFNNLEKLKKGDFIYVQSGEIENIYHVRTVELVDADEALVEISNREKKLTLSTCNSFGKVTDRFVVEADFIQTRVLSG